MEEIKLGILGMSPGNGHPYSWSAIFNGYNATEMATCPFPVIYEYLQERKFPEDSIPGASVSHVWCDNLSEARHVAQAAKIPEVVKHYEDMIGEVDGILLARDDAENHLEQSLPFLKAGLPLYIDKPLAYSVREAEEILDNQILEQQIFSVSALRYDQHLLITEYDLQQIGDLNRISACVPKSWLRYIIHVLDPLFASYLENKSLTCIHVGRSEEGFFADYELENSIELKLAAYETKPSPIQITLQGSRGSITKEHKDPFTAFKSALGIFADIVRGTEQGLSREEMLAPISIIEKHNDQ